MLDDNLYNFYNLGENEYYIKRKVNKIINYEKEYWSSVIDPDGKKRNRLKERKKHIEDVNNEISFINSLKPGKILDVGCGLGYLLSGINNQWDKYGVEISNFCYKYAKRWGKIYIGDLSESNYKNNYFDVIVLHHVIEHIDDPIKIILKIKNILNKNGYFIIGTPDFDSGCARLFKNNYRLLKDSTHISLFSNDSMHRFLRDYGFKIKYVDYPYFNTRYFTKNNLASIFDLNEISPPFYGNYMTFYCKLKD